MTLFSLGLFKKVILDDGISSYVAPAFDAAFTGRDMEFLESHAAALAYSLQIYFDFSAYADMAIGLSLLFGIRLPINFNSPYKAVNIVDFWRRWHMTLSRLLRDYLYIPMGGSRKGAARRSRTLSPPWFSAGCGTELAGHLLYGEDCAAAICPCAMLGTAFAEAEMPRRTHLVWLEEWPRD